MKKFILIITFLISGCSENISHYYPTYQDASEHQLFVRGWLPNILPESTTEINVNNDLDLDVSTGSFVIAKHDLTTFVSQLTPINNRRRFFEYSLGRSRWTFEIEENGLVSYILSTN
ncbi:hypothetical protein [Aliivibrio sifiae]|uniref:YbbD head domain-containing protein n=1 Tax=Aliivibrio sifiae TaxID=566293 RepID=A0A2S7XI68_9GAMM|nr:hypothetical protein [Aliivibrio sifiae]PQJ93415.1 hypothetical protein BTO23_04795 [Aliivibrio sifiae]GLR74501.1 hypothetical protein GCM10007855_13750 [Aliivibrio sifiae]